MIPAPWLDFATLLTQFLVPVFIITPLLVRLCERQQAAARRRYEGRTLVGPISQDDIDRVKQ